MDTSLFKKMKRHRHTFRLMGFVFVFVGGALSVAGISMLLDPDSTLIYNGVRTNAFSAKLQFTSFALFFVGAGLFFLIAKAALLDRIFVWRQSMLSLLFGKKR